GLDPLHRQRRPHVQPRHDAHRQTGRIRAERHDAPRFRPGPDRAVPHPGSDAPGVQPRPVLRAAQARRDVRSGLVPADAIDGQSPRYGLTVLDAYASELPPDAHEDDNSCNAADLRGTVVAPFRDTLTIENPHDIDWIRFHYTSGGLGTTAQLRLHAFPGVHPD